MIHEEALKAALAGGPRAPDLALHMEECPSCRSDLESFRALEEELRLAAGAFPRDEVWEHRLKSRLTHSNQSGRSWASVAASCLLASALLLAWTQALPGRKGSGEGNVASPPPSAIAAGTPVSPSHAGLTAWTGDEDSTAALLQLAEPLAEQLQEMPPDTLRNYLSTEESGGWNG